MTYSSVSDCTKLTGLGRYDDTNSGIITEAIDIAFLKVKAKVKKAGLTPPSSEDTLKAAEIEYVKADLIRRARMDGSLPKGEGSYDTYDSVNRAIALHIKQAEELIDAYLSYAVNNVQPSTTTGVSRSDYVFDNFKLDQGSVAEPVDIDGESLADDQRG